MHHGVAAARQALHDRNGEDALPGSEMCQFNPDCYRESEFGNVFGLCNLSVEILTSFPDSENLCTQMISKMVLDALHMSDGLDAVFIFIRTPNITTLEERLRGRDTDSDTSIRSRVHQAKADLSFCKGADGKRLVDHCLNNDDLETTYSRLREIVADEFPYIALDGGSVNDAATTDERPSPDDERARQKHDIDDDAEDDEP